VLLIASLIIRCVDDALKLLGLDEKGMPNLGEYLIACDRMLEWDAEFG
jgi:hypothetical protein